MPQGEYNDNAPVNNGQRPNSKISSARHGHTRNASAAAATHNNSLKNDLNNSFNPLIRPLPVHEKEEVFNEWGAVIKHQDEIDRELKRIQEQKFRERQKNYKFQLDQQYKEYLNKKKGSLSEQAKREDNMLKQYQRDLEEKSKMEDEKRNQMLNEEKSAALQSMNELNAMKRQQQSIRDMERQIYSNKLKLQEELDNQKKREEKEKMRNDQASYSKILALQHKSKLDQKNSERVADRQFSEAERLQMNKVNDQRDQFFEKLHKIQEINDLKQKKLQEYMQQDPKELRSKQDEKNYLRNMEIAEK